LGNSEKPTSTPFSQPAQISQQVIVHRSLESSTDIRD
jgi:hypothetical protein